MEKGTKIWNPNKYINFCMFGSENLNKKQNKVGFQRIKIPEFVLVSLLSVPSPKKMLALFSPKVTKQFDKQVAFRLEGLRESVVGWMGLREEAGKEKGGWKYYIELNKKKS